MGLLSPGSQVRTLLRTFNDDMGAIKRNENVSMKHVLINESFKYEDIIHIDVALLLINSLKRSDYDCLIRTCTAMCSSITQTVRDVEEQ